MSVQSSSRRVTSTDVARAAGVSRTTVSYVLNNAAHQKIPEETRQRVLDAAARLAYAPSAAARALRTGRTDTVLCLLPDWPISPTVGALLEHLSAALASSGLMLVIHPRSGEARPIADVWKAITPAAVISFEDFTREDYAALRAAGIDLLVTVVGRTGRGRDLGIPHETSGRLQVEHLAAAGHRCLGYALPDDDRVQVFARPRLKGVQQTCAVLGLDDPVALIVPLDPSAAAQAVCTWRSAKPPVTAVCCFNDNVALAVLAGMRRLGMRAPHDLAVIGVDDIAAARLADPPLTTVATDLPALATHVAETITSGLNGAPRARRASPEMVHLVRRSST
jgi:DNA-binding LacI/PurR family transcriptional regulator